MHITLFQSLAISLWIALVMSRSLLGGATVTLRFSPMMTGFFVGIVFGRIADAMIITAAIQLIYMGVFSPGGQMPSEPAIAAAVAVPVALLSNLSPEAAIAVAVPVGLLGSYLYQFRFFVNTFIMQKFTDKYAEEGNSKMLTFSIVIMPIIVSLLIFVPFMFIALYYGAPVIDKFIASNSSGILFHILSVIGGGLAAIGISVTIYVIGKKNYLAFFLLAYFMSVVLKPLNITMITYAIIGALISFIFILSKNESIEAVSSSVVLNQEDDDDY